MRERQPTIGNRYTIEEQCEFHGGNPKASAPEKDGRVVLVRVHPERNPDAPLIMDWRRRNSAKPRAMLLQGGIPFYIRHQANEWEYIGKFEVVYATTNRSPVTRLRQAHTAGINEVLYLEGR
jgi:hypothetical protein